MKRSNFIVCVTFAAGGVLLGAVNQSTATPIQHDQLARTVQQHLQQRLVHATAHGLPR